MAYSDYGAYIWKNGEDITEECADISCKIIDGKFVNKNWYENLINSINNKEELATISGHAVLILDNFCLSFYKTYNPRIHFLDGTSRELKLNNLNEYKSKKLKLSLYRYNLGYDTGYFWYEITYNNDIYCIIIGSSIGCGWDSTPASKYVLKHLEFVKDEEDNTQSFYRFNIKRNVDTDIVFNKLSRLDDINFRKYFIHKYTKNMFYDLIRFRFKSALWNIDQILDYREEIKWLK